MGDASGFGTAKAAVARPAHAAYLTPDISKGRP